MIASPVANIFSFDFDCSAQSRKLTESAVYAILGQLGSTSKLHVRAGIGLYDMIGVTVSCRCGDRADRPPEAHASARSAA